MMLSASVVPEASHEAVQSVAVMVAFAVSTVIEAIGSGAISTVKVVSSRSQPPTVNFQLKKYSM